MWLFGAARQIKGLGTTGLSLGIEIVGDAVSAQARSEANLDGDQYSIALIRRAKPWLRLTLFRYCMNFSLQKLTICHSSIRAVVVRHRWVSQQCDG